MATQKTTEAVVDPATVPASELLAAKLVKAVGEARARKLVSVLMECERDVKSKKGSNNTTPLVRRKGIKMAIDAILAEPFGEDMWTAALKTMRDNLK